MDEPPQGESQFQEDMVVDTHVHSADYLPPFAAGIFRWFTRHTRPPDFSFQQLPSAGVDAIVANAVGDRIVTAWWFRASWDVVTSQLRRIRAQAEQADALVTKSARQVFDAFESGRSAVVLGLEGGDAIGDHLERVDELFEWGVRALVPVHLTHNQLGTTCLPWQRYLGPFPTLRRRNRGLTPFGRRVIDRMNSLGMMIDVSHADSETLNDIINHTRKPVIASHAGAKEIEGFERFLDDQEIVGVARTGGLVGLWPYRYRGHGAVDMAALMRHARHIADLVGPAHLGLGTDMNGVPGLTAGYRGEHDVRLIAEHLRATGFRPKEIEGIMGRNFMRVFAEAGPQSPPPR